VAWGVVLAFTSSFVIVFIVLFRRGLGLMDIVTALYFLVAFIAVFLV
jgi:hypothetical protein